MTSQINYNILDANFPVAGHDNDSQGFRDNFQIIKNNFESAATEISALQANAVLAGQTTNLSGGTIKNMTVVGLQEFATDLGTVQGAIIYDLANGNYQLITLGGSITITCPVIKNVVNAITIKLGVQVSDPSYTLTWPDTVSKNITNLDNQNGQITRFTSAGYYVFQLTTTDGGVTWFIDELSRNQNNFQGDVTVSGMTDMNGGTRYSVQFTSDATNGGTTQLLSNVGLTVIRSANNSITSYTVLMPTTPSNGQEIKLAFANTIPALTMTATSPTVVHNGLNTVTAGSGSTWIYHIATDAWYRVG
jgi:hypothetical protein